MPSGADVPAKPPASVGASIITQPRNWAKLPDGAAFDRLGGGPAALRTSGSRRVTACIKAIRWAGFASVPSAASSSAWACGLRGIELLSGHDRGSIMV